MPEGICCILNKTSYFKQGLVTCLLSNTLQLYIRKEDSHFLSSQITVNFSYWILEP